MLQIPNKTLSRQVTEKLVRIGIAIAGLLILRGILSLMPMLRTEPIYPSIPQIGSDAAQIEAVDQGLRRLPDSALRKLLARAVEEEIKTGLDPSQQPWNEWLIAEHLAIFPITIAKAVIDTLVLALLSLFGSSLAHLFRDNYTRLPDVGHMMNFSILTIVAAIAYYSYQGVANPLLMPNNTDIYGWVFLVLVLAPLIGLAVVVGRNMDTITASLLRSGASSVAGPGASVATPEAAVRCPNCGQPGMAGVKFCPHCGASAVRAMAAAAATKLCSSCSTSNSSEASFCGECGHPV